MIAMESFTSGRRNWFGGVGMDLGGARPLCLFRKSQGNQGLEGDSSQLGPRRRQANPFWTIPFVQER
jgi:hypothetical protein